MNKIKFVDEQGSELNAYKVIKGDGSTENIRLLRNANITQVGTPLNAENLNLVMDDINELDGRVVDIGYLSTSVDDFALRVYNKAPTISSETNTNTGRLYIARVLDNVVVGQYSHDRVFVSIPYENGKYFTRYVYTISNGVVSKKEDLSSYSKEEIDNFKYRGLVLGNNVTYIASGDNINLAKYMQVGVYYGNNSSSTIVNCPTANKFKMEVFDIVGNNDRNPETQTWVYRVRIITDFNGEQWVQNPHSANTVGSFTNVKWKKILTDNNFALIPVLTATNTHTITLPSEGIYLITYSEEASEVISNPKTMSSYIISYRPGYTTRSNDDGIAVCSCSATGVVSNARVIEADWQVYRLTNTW